MNYEGNKDLMAGTFIIGALVHSGITPDLFGFDLEADIERTHYFGSRPKTANNTYHNVDNDINIILSLTQEEKVRIIE